MAKDKKKNSRSVVAPTKQQQRRYDYALEAITERGQIIGRAYRRRPLFETMYSRSEITRDEVRALRYYRERFEISHRSLTRSCLNQRFGRGNGSVPPIILRASREVTFMENAAGIYLDTLRAVALEDMSFNRIAIERYGSEQVTVGNRTRFVPKRKSHARRVRSEFMTALTCFISAAESLYSVNFPVDVVAHKSYKSGISGNASKHATPEQLGA